MKINRSNLMKTYLPKLEVMPLTNVGLEANDASLPIRADEVVFSKESKKLSPDVSSFYDQINQMNAQKDDQDNTNDELLICISLATRIIAGDRIPKKDERFLAQKQPKMYANAIMLRRLKKEYKDYKSVLNEEETKDKIASSSDINTLPVSKNEELASDLFVVDDSERQ